MYEKYHYIETMERRFLYLRNDAKGLLLLLEVWYLYQFAVKPHWPDYKPMTLQPSLNPHNNMVEKKKKKKGGEYCVAGGPNLPSCNNSSYTEGVSMHYFPKEENPHAKWVNKMGRHQKDFIPCKSLSLCSIHFDRCCLERRPLLCSEDKDMPMIKKYLLKTAVSTRGMVNFYSPPNSR